ncbi:hypothetical protein RB195_018079 [Necator americanus]|uniref:Reverse transcriptase domain-containing protein n=1 Tax=Necator americanus TaxID=51031 RepID=A0ABR1C839_NECAM
MDERIEKALDEGQPCEQAGFRKGFSTIDHIHTVSKLIEVSREYKMPLFLTFIDLKKAFDSVETEAVVEALDNQGVPTQYIKPMQLAFLDFEAAFDSPHRCRLLNALRADEVPGKFVRLLDDMNQRTAAVRTPAGCTTPFKEVTGVRQGAVAGPFLFNFAIDDIMRRTVDQCPADIVLAPSGCPLTDLEYADDVVIFAESSTKLQHVINLVSKLAATYGLRLRPDKCKQMWISSRPRTGIRADGQQNSSMSSVTWAATSAFNSLTECLWSTPITNEVKLRVYLSAIRPIMMYGSESWAAPSRVMKRLDCTERKLLRRLLGYFWPRVCHNEDLYAEIDVVYRRMTRGRYQHLAPPSKAAKVKGKVSLRFFGHILRRLADRLVQRVLKSSSGSSWKKPPGQKRKFWTESYEEEEVEAFYMDLEKFYRELFTATLENAMRKLEWDDMGVKVDGRQLHHLRFTDDIVLITPSISQAERMLTEFDETCGCIGLQLNLQKTMFMRNGWVSDAPFTLNGTNISECTSYIYLGRELNMMNDLTPELGRRRRAAWGAYKSIVDVVKKTRHTRLRAHLFNTTVLPALTYASETWAFRKHEENAGRDSKFSPTSAKIRDAAAFAKESKIRWAGHVMRFNDNRWTRAVSDWVPSDINRTTGRPPTRWSDYFKKSFKEKYDALRVPRERRNHWATLARDRDKWKNYWRSLEEFENQRESR